MKVLLVDDEKMEREGLRDYMPWDQLGLEVCGEASDGMYALKLSAEMKPEIVISDIKMPGTDGIELATRLREMFPDIKVIFISGYQEFEYARKAIMLNAYGYILKPVNFKKLAELLDKVVAQIKEEQYSARQKEELRQQIKENRQYLQQQFLRDLLQHSKRNQRNMLVKRADYLGLSFPYDYFSVAVVAIDDYKEIEERLSEENKQFLNTIVFNMLRRISIGDSCMHIVQAQDGVFSVIINTSENGTIRKDEILGSFEAFLKQLSISCDKTATVGFSDFSKGIEEIQVLYRHAVAATKAKWSLGKGLVIFASDISIGSSSMLDNQNDLEQIHEISQYVLAGDIESTKETLSRVFDSIKGETCHSQQSIRNMCLMLINECRQILLEIEDDPENILGSYFSIYDTVFHIETLTDLESWLIAILAKVSGQIQEKRKAKNSRLVDAVTEIVNNRYHENIGMEEISNEVYFSSNYIRKVFKDETGHTVTDYLLQVRMKRAVELMKDPKLHVYDIGQQVGYENTSYFCQVFKHYYGVTPKEYMDSLNR